MKSKDALSLLISEHREVEEKFKAFTELGTRSKVSKKRVADEICQALTLHTRVEEDIFYPAVRKAISDNALMDKALVEHAGAKELIAQIRSMDPGEELYDAKVQVLCEQITHHVQEEEQEIFPKVRKTKLDLVALGEEIEAYKETA